MLRNAGYIDKRRVLWKFWANSGDPNRWTTRKIESYMTEEEKPFSCYRQMMLAGIGTVERHEINGGLNRTGKALDFCHEFRRVFRRFQKRC